MKVLLLCVAMLCLMPSAFGQRRTLHLPKAHSNDTTNFWYQTEKKREQTIGLNAVESSPNPVHFRLSITGGTILDVWQKDNQFFGAVTIWVKDTDEALWSFERIHSQQYKFEPETAAAIGQLVISSGIIELPSEENIPGWQKGIDGEEIVVQYSNSKAYYLKNYWTPSAQKGLPEALLVQKFCNTIFELANMKVVRKSFVDGTPFQCYTTDGSMTTCKIVRSMAEYWQYKRSVSQFLRQNKKKIN